MTVCLFSNPGVLLHMLPDLQSTSSRLKIFNGLFITEVRPLKRVAREKWGTHDAFRASRPRNEVVKAADVFGFL